MNPPAPPPQPPIKQEIWVLARFGLSRPIKSWEVDLPPPSPADIGTLGFWQIWTQHHKFESQHRKLGSRRTTVDAPALSLPPTLSPPSSRHVKFGFRHISADQPVLKVFSTSILEMHTDMKHFDIISS